MNNLKTCPLCGGDAELTRSASTDTLRVFCKACRCNTGGYQTEEEAVAAWNRRFVPKGTDLPWPYSTFGDMYETAKNAFFCSGDNIQGRPQ